MTRRPADYRGAGRAVYGDVQDEASLRRALDGVESAYYLVHSLERDDFEHHDARAARTFARAAAEAGVRQIIYLGGLGKDGTHLSSHLRSRRQVERLLRSTDVPVTVLRAAVIVGHGGISWEITRQLVEHLPAMVAPRWVRTRTQPISLHDTVRYLVGVLGRADALDRIFEIGGPEVMRYVDMLKRVARIRNKLLPIVEVPLLSPRLSSAWLALVTDVEFATARNLVDSMITEVVAIDDDIRRIVPGELQGFDDAVRSALQARHGERARAGR
jgi:uncharacterized protein YbjT (DUF2867 family)